MGFKPTLSKQQAYVIKKARKKQTDEQIIDGIAERAKKELPDRVGDEFLITRKASLVFKAMSALWYGYEVED